MSAAVSIKGLVKQYKNLRALNGLELEIPRGSICALVGSNGAGKTTLMSIASGLIKPDAGSCNIFGDGLFNPAKHAGRVAILPQDSVPPRYARVDHTLYYYAQLQGLHGAAAKEAVREVLRWVNLEDRLTSSVRALSHGMLRRFTVAQAFLGNPELVLLDEPMSGLDPVEVNNLRNLIISRRNKQTIVISSHILHELESVCDRAVFIEKGQLVRQDAMAHITRLGQQINFHLTATPPLDALKSQLPDHEIEFDQATGILHIHLASNETEAPDIGEINHQVITVLQSSDCRILEIAQGSNLEQEYLKQRENP